MTDQPRPVATRPDSAYSLSIEDTAALYARSGHPRTLRTLQRYCSSGHLDCVKAATLMGDKYFVEPSSVARHIAEIDELIALDGRAPGPATPRPDATSFTAEIARVDPRHDATGAPSVSGQVAVSFGDNLHHRKTNPSPDHPRPAATDPEHVSRPDAALAADVSRHVTQLEREVERLSEDRSFLRQQIATKDEQIAALLERDRETNILVRGLQQMLSPLLGGPRGDGNTHRDARFD